MGNNVTVKNKTGLIAVRVPPELKARIEAVQQQTGLDEPTIVRNAVAAFCKYVEEFDESPPFPIEFRKPGKRKEEGDSSRAMEMNETPGKKAKAA